MRTASKAVFFFFVFLVIFITTVCLWFIFNVFVERHSSIISKTGKSLVIASVVQILICVVMLYLPMIVATFAWGWNIHGSTTIANAFLLLQSFHCTVDMVDHDKRKTDAVAIIPLDKNDYYDDNDGIGYEKDF
uniref:G_PROTEIN_RECEP_F2_4 domain-containing protein n=1 Tax=Panagrellus redivivus TaxID=6233 RepID=A0A7E4V426_PANRE